jgi:hypothetical protein
MAPLLPSVILNSQFSFVPVSRPTAVMCDREYRNVTGEANEYDVIGKVVHRQAPHVSICNAWNECPGLGKLLEMLKCLPDFSGESVRDLAAPLSIPRRGFAQFDAGAFAEANRLQRANTSR